MRTDFTNLLVLVTIGVFMSVNIHRLKSQPLQYQPIETLWNTNYTAVNFPNWWNDTYIGFDLSLTTYDDSGRTIFVIQTNDTFIQENNVVPNWFLCPNNTNHIVSNRVYNTSFSQSVPYLEHTLGCCPLGQTGCVQPLEDRLLGCCPAGTYCVIDYNGDAGSYSRKFGVAKFLGCVPDQSYLCPKNPNTAGRCPLGYGCCGNKGTASCMPIVNSATSNRDYQAFCGKEVNQTVQIWTIGASQTLGIQGSGIYPTSWNWTYYYSLKDDSPFLDDPSLQVDGEQRRCVSTGYFCYEDETCLTGNNPFSLNGTWLLTDQELFCLPSHYYINEKGWTELEVIQNLAVCYEGPVSAEEVFNITHPAYPSEPINIVTYPGPLGNYSLASPFDVVNSLFYANISFMPNRILGFADSTLNETCCGRSICQNGQKCCEVKTRINYNETYPNLLVDSGLRFCCPEELSCCYGQPPAWTYDASDVPLSQTIKYGSNQVPGLTGHPFQEGFYGYCGMTINGQQCAMDRMMPSSWYALDRYSSYVV